MSRRILNGWKEIANHIERSVRTAQRWEAKMGLSVHRPARKDSGVVVAFSDELEGWICRAPAPTVDSQPAFTTQEQEDQNLLRVLEDMSTLVWDTAELASRVRMLQEQLQQSLQPYRYRLAPRPRPRRALAGHPLGSLLNFPRVQTDHVAGELPQRSQVPEPSRR